MTTEIRDLLSKRIAKKFATDTGTNMHSKMQRVFIDEDGARGDPEIVQKIRSNTGLLMFFGANSQTEVPIAGTIRGKFISRRIDRLVVDDIDKKVLILDYKTDIDKNAFHDLYVFQINEYRELLQKIYPNYQISGFILWLHDWSCEKIS